ncbi:hypothetical protein LTR66_000854 [Elasticomyces elasticus]|nr:hypothetical protein LTR66_000854 [Elasticomyces elasticus]
MSVTTTTDTARYTIHAALADYDLHHSDGGDTAPPPAAHPAPPAQNPPDWDTQHRRVPAYRPINYELEAESPRQVFTSVPERIFIRIMFLGVGTNAAVAQLWRNTLGTVNDQIFRYKIGGEW